MKPGVYLRPLFNMPDEPDRFVGWEIIRVCDNGTSVWTGWQEDFGHKSTTTRLANRRAKQLAKAYKVPFHGEVPKENPDADTLAKIGRAILQASARAVYVSSFAERAEDLGVRVPGGPGSDWMDIAPETSPAAFEWAEALWQKIVDQNDLAWPAGTELWEKIADLWSEAAMREEAHQSRLTPKAGPSQSYSFEDIFNDEEDYTEFGHYIAMEGMGHGVSWSDDHAEHGLEIPHEEADAWAIVPDADLGVVVNQRDLREAIEGVQEDDDERREDDPGTYEYLEAYEEAWNTTPLARYQPPVEQLREVLNAISRLNSHLNYAASYTSENFERARDLAGVLHAVALRDYETAGGR